MATVQTTSTFWDSTADSTLPKLTHAVYNRSLLSRAHATLLHDKFGQRKPLKKRNGTTMVFRRYESLDTTTTPLTEGVTPTGTSLSHTNVQATIKQYGNYTVLSDLVDMTHYDDLLNISSELMGENMGESMDLVYREILNAGTQGLRCTSNTTYGDDDSTARSLVDGKIHKGVLDGAINILDRENAKKFTTLIQGADKDNTWPVAPSYWALIHPDVERDLYNSDFTIGADFTPVERYANQTQVMPSEIGKYRSIRFVTSTNAKIWTDSGHDTVPTGIRSTLGTHCDVYSTLIFARDAYGIIPLNGGSTRTIIHRAGGNTDPLNQRNTVGWKAATTAVILKNEWMVRIESASTA